MEERGELGQDQAGRSPHPLPGDRKMRHAERQAATLDRVPATASCVAQFRQRQLDDRRHFAGIGPKNERLADLSVREFATFAPLIVLAVWIGLYPKPFLDRLDTSVRNVVLRVSPQYAQAYAEQDAGRAADCDTTPTPAVVAANTAGQFLSAVPCGPDGQPLAPDATGQTGVPR